MKGLRSEIFCIEDTEYRYKSGSTACVGNSVQVSFRKAMNATKMMATKNLNGHQNVEWPDIDLAEEHNILLREELAAICKNVVNRKVPPKHSP